jgi:hypothetical protein
MNKHNVDDVIFRMKNLKEYKVVRPLADEFVLNGKMPYDIKLDKDNMLTVTLMAVDRVEAERRVDEFLEGMRDD